MELYRRSPLALKALTAAVVLGFPVLVACGGRVASDGAGNNGGSSSSNPAPTSSATSSATGSASSSPAPTAQCDANGFSTLSGSSCAVSFQTDIFPLMSPSGAWSCSNENCHGPTGTTGMGTSTGTGTGLNQPTIDGSSARKAYESLAQLSLDGAPYINGCSSDPSASSMLCNVEGSCSTPMPTSGAGVSASLASPDQIDELKTWLACGAPFN